MQCLGTLARFMQTDVSVMKVLSRSGLARAGSGSVWREPGPGYSGFIVQRDTKVLYHSVYVERILASSGQLSITKHLSSLLLHESRAYSH